MALDKPRKFGKYLLLDKISMGGMAEVYRAKVFGAAHFEKLVAIKRILPALSEDKAFIKMFIDEAKIAGQLDHPNIARIYELGRVEGHYFIAMEYVWGKNLKEIMARFRKQRAFMNPYQAAFITSKICEGLDYAHRKTDVKGRPLGIIHRDVTPQNVLLSYSGDVKVIDFGIAKARDRSSHTAAGVLKGKFAYMSPEQVRGLPLDHRSDIFSIGILLYEMLTSTQLFGGESDLVVLEKVRKVEVPDPLGFNPRIPKPLVSIAMKALSKDPDSRYQWASDMQEELERFLMTARPFYTSKRLGIWMKKVFAREIAKEKEQLKARIAEWEAEQRRLESKEEEEEGDGATVIMDDEEFPEEGEATVILNPYDDAQAMVQQYAGGQPQGDTTQREMPLVPDEDEGKTVMLDEDDTEGKTVMLDDDDDAQALIRPQFSAGDDEGETVIFDDESEVSIPGLDRPSFVPDSSDFDDTPVPAGDDGDAAIPGLIPDNPDATMEVGKVSLNDLVGDSKKKGNSKLYIYAGSAAALSLIIGLLMGYLLFGGSKKPSTAHLVLFAGTDKPVTYLLDSEKKIKTASGMSGTVVEVPPGPHLVEIRSNGYEPFTTNFDVKAGQTLPVVARLKRLSIPVKVKLYAAGAKIHYKDRVFDSKATIEIMPGKTFTVTLTRLGFIDRDVLIRVPADAPKEMKLTLPSLKKDRLGQVRMESTPPGAFVMLGSTDICKTPCTIKGLDPRLPYKFQLLKGGFKPTDVEVTFDPTNPVLTKKVPLPSTVE